MILSRLFSRWRSDPAPTSHAALNQLWIAAYAQGFQAALTMGLEKVGEAIRTAAINETLQNLAATHQLYTAQTKALRPTVDLLKKREEFQTKAASAVGAEGEKYKHYVTAIDWALSATNGH